LSVGTALGITVAVIVILGIFRQTAKIAWSLAGIILLVWWLRYQQKKGKA